MGILQQPAIFAKLDHATVAQTQNQARTAAGRDLIVTFQFGTEGWQLDERLAARPVDVRVRKTATDSFHRTELQALLQSHGISQLVVCGLQSEFCVDSTVRQALALGYPVALVSDAHSTLDNDVLSAAQISAHHTATLVNIGSFGPRVTATAAAELRVEA